MNQFNEHWQACARRAHAVMEKNESAPFGFTTRVISRTLAQDLKSTAPLEVVWERLAVRSLSWVALILLICALLELPHLHERKPLEPGIENTVGQLVWNL